MIDRVVFLSSKIKDIIVIGRLLLRLDSCGQLTVAPGTALSRLVLRVSAGLAHVRLTLALAVLAGAGRAVVLLPGLPVGHHLAVQTRHTASWRRRRV